MGEPTFLQQDALEQRVFISQHKTFISGATMVLLQGLQGLLVMLDGTLQLLDVLGATLAEGGLGLPVPLLALFRGGIDLSTLSG